MQKTNNPEDLQDGTEKVTGSGSAQNVFRQGFIPNQEQVQKCVAFCIFGENHNRLLHTTAWNSHSHASNLELLQLSSTSPANKSVGRT